MSPLWLPKDPSRAMQRCFLGRGCLGGISSSISLPFPEGGEKFWLTSGLLCCPDDLHLRKLQLEGKPDETLRDRSTLPTSDKYYLFSLMCGW